MFQTRDSVVAHVVCYVVAVSRVQCIVYGKGRMCEPLCQRAMCVWAGLFSGSSVYATVSACVVCMSRRGCVGSGNRFSSVFIGNTDRYGGSHQLQQDNLFSWRSLKGSMLAGHVKKRPASCTRRSLKGGIRDAGWKNIWRAGFGITLQHYVYKSHLVYGGSPYLQQDAFFFQSWWRQQKGSMQVMQRAGFAQ